MQVGITLISTKNMEDCKSKGICLGSHALEVGGRKQKISIIIYVVNKETFQV